MKHIFVRMVLVLGLISMLGGLFGCRDNRNDGITSDENEVDFSSFTQEQRKTYISEYLFEQYNEKCTVSDVERKSINQFENEQFYYAIATTDKNKKIFVWISRNGIISDSYFMFAYESIVADKLQKDVENELGELNLYVNVEIREKPTKVWKKDDSVESFFETETVYSYIYIFTDLSDFSKEDEQRLAKSINYTDGKIMLFDEKSPQSVVFGEQDLTDYDRYVLVKKDI